VRQDRAFTLTIKVLLILTAAAHPLGYGVLRDSFWGVHLYSFFGLPVLIVATVLLLACWFLLRGERAPNLDRLQALPDPGGWSLRWRVLGGVALAVAGGVVFWLARSGHVILGDGSVLVVNIPQGESFHPRQPLTALLQQGIYQLAGGLFAAPGLAEREVARQALALGSVLAGALFVPVAWATARELVCLRLRDDQAGAGWTTPAVGLICLVLLSQGYIQLFCGYVENYTYFALGAGLFLWTGLRYLRTGRSLLAVTVALLLTLCLHLSGAIFVPAMLVLIGWGLARKETRKAAVRDLAAGVVLCLAAGWALSRLTGGYNLLDTLVAVSRLALLNEEANAPGYLLSGVHLRNFWNEQLLIGPLGLLLFLPAIVVALRAGGGRRPAVLFLLAAGLAYLGASWFAGESNLGYPRNWDLLAPGSLVFTTAGLGLFLAAGDRSGGGRTLAGVVPALLCAVAISLYHTVPWVAVNTSFASGFARLKTLPSLDGITEANVGRWYLLQDDPAQGRLWLRKALQVNPRNNNAHYMLGSLALREGDFATAVEALSRAVAIRPDKIGYRESLTEALLSAGRWAEALVQCEILVSGPSPAPRFRGWHGLALWATGRTDDARAALASFRATAGGDPPPAEEDRATMAVIGSFFLQRGNEELQAGRFGAAVAAYREALTWSPAGTDAVLNLGFALAQLTRYEEAVTVFRQGLARHPDSIDLLFNLGAVLHTLGRPAEARPVLERALRLAPSGEQAEQIRGLLQSLAG